MESNQSCLFLVAILLPWSAPPELKVSPINAFSFLLLLLADFFNVLNVFYLYIQKCVWTCKTITW